VYGAAVIVPDTLHPLFLERLASAESGNLVSFLSYRSNRSFSRLMLEKRPGLLCRLHSYFRPIKDDIDACFAAALHEQGLLPEELRSDLVQELRDAAIESADASFLDDSSLEAILTEDEKSEILAEIQTEVLSRLDDHIDRVEGEWDRNYPPEDLFEDLKRSIKLFVGALSWTGKYDDTVSSADRKIARAIERMNEDYEPASSTAASTQLSAPPSASLQNVFRDIDE